MVEAHERAERARERVADLQDLLVRLEAGDDLTEADLEKAESAIRNSVEAARDARQHDRDELLLSAATHRRAADLLTRMGQTERASGHLQAAEADERHAQERSD